MLDFPKFKNRPPRKPTWHSF